ncbi:MAG: Unknown protein [uncultured Sulfurovum sp.]|uniref:Uncharacterized protein n=1 Tax=uncultured Sulfurovum sp. TaxID=269237 RepID=A0A6S6TYG4_9BACT|nr:MAG: Unknown protein [uncultured Sulfurovum sp.]
MSNKPHNTSPNIKKKKPESLLEKVGVKYFNSLSKHVQADREVHLEDIPSDKVLQVVANNISIAAIIIAFLVGALTTIPAVIFEMYLRDEFSTLNYYLFLSAITLVFLIIEVGILYWIAMRSAYTLAYMMGYDEKSQDNLPPEYDVNKMMVRSALELDDPTVEYLGINPHKHVSKKWLVLTALLYKAKIILTSIVIKLIFQKIAARYGLRVSFVWIAIPVTAIWDAVVMHYVIKDARLRLFGYHLSKYITEEVFSDELLNSYSPHVREGMIRAVSTIMTFSGSFHPNNMILLIRLSQNFNIDKNSDYDDLEKLLEHLKEASSQEQHLLKILAGITAGFDGKITKAEKSALLKIFNEEDACYMNFTQALQAYLLHNRLHKSASFCKEALLKRKESI